MREGTIGERFVGQVLRTPENLAVRIDRRSVTYGELGTMAAQIAGAIGHNQSGRPAAILMGEGPLHMAAMFAAAKRGRPFIPLEANMPKARLADIIAASGATDILTDFTHLQMARQIGSAGTPVINVEATNSATLFADSAAVSPDAVAAIVYTSGSTGRPKGVAVSHQQLLHSADTRARLGEIGANDRFAHVHASGGASSLHTILLPLLNGAACCVFDLHRHGLHNLGPWMVAENVTGIQPMASLLRAWITSLPAGFKIPSLRLIIPGGEPVYGADISLTARHLTGDWRVLLHLSSTEAGFLAVRTIGPKDVVETGILHVGWPVAGKDVVLVPEPDGQSDGIGEIVVRGRCISPGYWNEPALTATAFSTDPSDERARHYRTGDLGRWRADGSLEYLGRKGRRLKLRGYAIEPYEIENALLRIAGVRDTVVVARGAEADRHLAAYLVADGGAHDNPAEVRRQLSTTLPHYMMPRHVIILDAFPLTGRGKVDLNALPIPNEEISDGSYRAPQTEQERVIVSIWQEVLQKPRIGVDDDFYQLGGTSLQAFVIFARIADALGYDVPPTTMLQAPTIAKQSALLGRSAERTNGSRLVPFRQTGSGSPLFVVHGAFGDIMFVREIVRDLKSDRPVYGLQPPPLDGVHAAPRTMESVAADYVMEIRKVLPKGPYFLTGYSFGGIVAVEMAQQLRRAGEQVAFVGLIDAIYDGQYQIAGESNGARVERHLRHLRGLRAPLYVAERSIKTLGYFARALREAIGELPNELRCRLGRPIPYSKRTAFYRQVFTQAGRRYRLKSYAGMLTMFSAKGRAEWHRKRWSSVAEGGLTIYEIAADHFDMVWPPHSTALAAAFDSALDDVIPS
jgi:amino acid adenylation domain-containing protein